MWKEKQEVVISLKKMPRKVRRSLFCQMTHEVGSPTVKCIKSYTLLSGHLDHIPKVSRYAGVHCINSNDQLKLPKRVKSPAYFMLSVRINVLCPAELVCVRPNLKLYPAILLTEVDMYADGLIIISL